MKNGDQIVTETPNNDVPFGVASSLSLVLMISVRRHVPP